MKQYLTTLREVNNSINRQDMIAWFNERGVDYAHMNDLDMYIYFIEQNGHIEVSEDEDYFDAGWRELKKILMGQKFGDFVFEEEDMVGSVYLYRNTKGNELSVYCSPFWEMNGYDIPPVGEDVGLNVTVSDDDGDTIADYVIPHAYPTDALEFDVFKIWYVERLEELSKKY